LASSSGASSSGAAGSGQNLVLTGFMTTGKTTVGQLVAQMTGWRFIDADALIVERAGMSIPELFAAQGEAAFRRLEAEVCRELAAGQRQVIATGGGMLIDADNRRVMQEAGLVVCLTASPEAIRTRISGDATRPLAAGWESLLAARQPIYESFAHRIDTSNRTPHEVAQEVMKIWQTAFA